MPLPALTTPDKGMTYPEFNLPDPDNGLTSLEKNPDSALTNPYKPLLALTRPDRYANHHRSIEIAQRTPGPRKSARFLRIGMEALKGRFPDVAVLPRT